MDRDPMVNYQELERELDHLERVFRYLIQNVTFRYLRGRGEESHNKMLSEIGSALRFEGYDILDEYELMYVDPRYPDFQRGFIDIVALGKNLRVGIEFDSKRKIKKRSIYKMISLYPRIAFFLSGYGSLQDQGDRIFLMFAIGADRVYFGSWDQKDLIRIR